MTRTFAIAAALAATLASAPAFAGEMKVRYNDLDLATAGGQRALERRIDRAAQEVCNYDAQMTGTRLRSSENLACYQEAKAKARTAMASLISDERLGG